jgi:hypothetical protein
VVVEEEGALVGAVNSVWGTASRSLHWNHNPQSWKCIYNTYCSCLDTHDLSCSVDGDIRIRRTAADYSIRALIRRGLFQLKRV